MLTISDPIREQVIDYHMMAMSNMACCTVHNNFYSILATKGQGTMVWIPFFSYAIMLPVSDPIREEFMDL